MIVSAINGLGTGDLLDKILTYFHPESNDEVEEELPRFAVVGRPNAGKSSLIKADTFDWQYNAAEFYKLGLGDPLIVSYHIVTGKQIGRAHV